MYIKFQQNRVSRSVKTVHTHIFANDHKLFKFATTTSNFFLNRLFLTCIIVYRTCISNFSKFRLVDQSIQSTQKNWDLSYNVHVYQ